MAREKEGFRDTMEQLNEMFPETGMLNRKEVARFLGVNPTTVGRIGIRFNEMTGKVTKADLARQVCI